MISLMIIIVRRMVKIASEISVYDLINFSG